MSEFRPERRSAPQIPKQPAPRPSRRSALLLWALAGVGLILTNLLSLPLARPLAGLDPQLQALVYNLFYYLLFALLPLWLLARRRPGLGQAFRPYPISLFSTLSVIALALLGLLFTIDFSALWAMLLEALGLQPGGAALAIPSSRGGLALCVFSVAVLPAVCEELVFRGAILPALEPCGTKRAVLLSALMFALLHGSLTGLPLQFLIGAILGWLVVCCDSIYAGLIYHTTHNAANILLEYALTRGAGANAAAAAQYASTFEAVGGRSGVLQLLLELLMLGVMMFFSLRMFRVTAQLRGVGFFPSRRGEKLRASEWGLLLLGLVISGLLLGADIFAMLVPGGAP